MILSDTSVIVDYWRKPKPIQTHIFDYYPVAFCGITRAELYAGAKNDWELARYSQDLSRLVELPLENKLWEALGRNLQKLRSNGLILPFPDVVIATLALQHDLEIWTYDRHFALMQAVLPKLRLFAEPQPAP